MRVFLSYRRDDTAGRAESPTCFTVLDGDRDDVTPGSAASGLVGFNSTRDPTGAALALDTESGVQIPITSGT